MCEISLYARFDRYCAVFVSLVLFVQQAIKQLLAQFSPSYRLDSHNDFQRQLYQWLTYHRRQGSPSAEVSRVELFGQSGKQITSLSHSSFLVLEHRTLYTNYGEADSEDFGRLDRHYRRSIWNGSHDR